MKNINDETYTNRELWIKNEDYQKANDLAHKELSIKLDEILVQVKKTNGSVFDLLLWRATVKGYTYVVPLLVSAVVGTAVAYIFNKFL